MMNYKKIISSPVREQGEAKEKETDGTQGFWFGQEMKDPFEAAVEEQESPPESPIPPEEDTAGASVAVDGDEEEVEARSQPAASAPSSAPASGERGKEEDEEEEENMKELSKLPSDGDPNKLAKMQ